MASFVYDYDMSTAQPKPARFSDFRKILDRAAEHPNRRYFIFKSIIVNNLFGVDIMDEAVEICKLRLFLKLVAQVERVESIEPLPDIDFNIRAGNTLVGYATAEEVRQAFASQGKQMKLLSDEEMDAMGRFEEKAADVDRLFQHFRQQQTELGGQVTSEDKQELRRRLQDLEEELNRYLAGEYGVAVKKKATYQKWLETHQPFQWFIEFYGILKQGGFDVVIGNPPYVQYKDVKSTYVIRGFQTLPCGDLYAYVLERTYSLMRSSGYIGMIVPISIFGTDGFKPLQDLSTEELDSLWVSTFANRPSQLFSGAQKRITILIGSKGRPEKPTFHTTTYIRWSKDERDTLFASRIQYFARESYFLVFPASLEKLGGALQTSAFLRLLRSDETLGTGITGSNKHRVCYTRKFGYFLAFLDFVPRIVDIETGDTKLPSELKMLSFNSKTAMLATIAALSSSTFFWFWNVLSDCRNLNRRDLLAFPLNPERISDEMRKKLSELGQEYLDTLRATSRTMLKGGLQIETFEYALCKPVLDEIDHALSQFYDLTDEELDFIINYDIKYRMGPELLGN
jgi:hypothetical protein